MNCLIDIFGCDRKGQRFFPLPIIYLLLGYITCLGQAPGLKEIPFFQEGQVLTNPFAGGLNEPQFSRIDLDLDGKQDLVIFDRSGQVILPFVQENNSWVYDPSFQPLFPSIKNWLLVRDYNGDGLGDLFVDEAENSGIQVFTNTSLERLSFQLTYPLLSSDTRVPLFVPSTDIPGIADMNGDGKVDILIFDAAGSYLQLFQNRTSSGTNSPSLDLSLANSCWGNFREDGLTNEVFLNEACPTRRVSVRNGLHAGSTITPLPQNDQGLMDVLLGDISFENIVYLHNGGSLENPVIDIANPDFPSLSNPIFLPFFPAAFLLDLNFDGVEDLTIAPNASSISDNFDNIWFYPGENQGDSLVFALQQKDFLQNEMVDCGAISHPTTFDYNGDGLLDLVIGNKAYQTGGTFPSASLTLYQNTGSAQNPEFTLIDRNYLDLASVFSQIIQEVRPAFGDMDGDGDKDLILGDINGQVHLFLNTPEQGIANFALSEFNFRGIDVGQNASPQLVDLDQDNVLDLLIGEGNGTLNFFRNEGTLNSPQFSSEATIKELGGIDVSPECCTGFSVPFLHKNNDGSLDLRVGSESGELFFFPNISLQQQVFIPADPQGRNWGIGRRSSPWGVDLDDDGILDWLVGNSRGGIGIFNQPEGETVSNRNSLKKPSIRIFPNPSSEAIIYLSLPSTLWNEQLFVQVFSPHGSLVGENTYFAVRTPKLQLGELAPGVYSVHLHRPSGPTWVLKWLYLP